jgi:hypothetical protein
MLKVPGSYPQTAKWIAPLFSPLYKAVQTMYTMVDNYYLVEVLQTLAKTIQTRREEKVNFCWKFSGRHLPGV